MTGGSRWYVVYTQPHRERRAALNLRRQGLTSYLPMLQRTRRHARKTDTVSRPLFPRYMFVKLDLDRDRWRCVHSTAGVSHLVSRDEEPVPVPEGVVEEIRERENPGGFVTVGLPPGIGPGSSIRLSEGLFADSSGVLDRVADECRVLVLLQLLGREIRVSVPAATVSAA